MQYHLLMMVLAAESTAQFKKRHYKISTESMFIHVSGYEIPCGLKYAISKYGIMRKPYIFKLMLPYPS